jgi:AcrR family transcriptional regulator
VSIFRHRVNFWTIRKGSGEMGVMTQDAAIARSDLSLQDARKAFVRTRVCEAARELFFRQGYAATTLEQIAAAVGARRTTLYSHFRDKAEILEAIAEDYHAGLRGLVDRLPGPVPSRAEIETWIDELVAFVVRERTPATLMIHLGIAHESPPALVEMGERFLAALADRLPAFRRALEPGPEQPRAQAWARLLLRELSLGCLQAAAPSGGDRELLAAVAELLERFVRETEPPRVSEP